jgi:hypothetical protein
VSWLADESKEFTMPLSDDTIKRWKKLEEKIQDFISYFGCDRSTAMQMVCTNGAIEAMETAKRLEKRQEDMRVSELKRLRNLAAKEVGDIDTLLK